MVMIVSYPVDRRRIDLGDLGANQCRRKISLAWAQALQRRVVKEENVVLNLRDNSVPANDVGKARVLKCLELRAIENLLIPETVAVTNALELVSDDLPESRANASAGNMIFGEPADPKIE